jgi:hypothetical protein
MSGTVGQREIRTQRRVLEFFQDALGYARSRPAPKRFTICSAVGELDYGTFALWW